MKLYASYYSLSREKFERKENDFIDKYSVIYADPPWRYAQKGLQGAAENHYPTMSIEELYALPVADLAAPDSALFCGRRSRNSRRLCG